MVENGIRRLRVLIANERRDRLKLLANVVTRLGHEVIAREVDFKEVGAVRAREHPDVALGGLGLSSEHALDLIGEIVREASCPVIALLAARDPGYVREAAKRGVLTTPRTRRHGVDHDFIILRGAGDRLEGKLRQADRQPVPTQATAPERIGEGRPPSC